MKFVFRLVCIAILAASVGAPSAYADKDKKGNGYEKHKQKKHKEKGTGKGKHEEHDDHEHYDRVVIDTSDRVIIRKYIEQNVHAHCPPGLAKKNPLCLPPGQAKKLYVVGQPLSDVVIFRPVPRDLLVQLQAVPVGYQYVMVDRDVLLISEASHKVIDAITLLSAVGN